MVMLLYNRKGDLKKILLNLSCTIGVIETIVELKLICAVIDE